MIEYYDKEELELQISNYLSGNSTDEEKETLLAFLASNEAAARTFREMSAVWALSSVPSFAEIENSNLVRIKERMTAPASSKPVRKLIPVWLKMAAAVILLIGCNYFWYTYTENLTEVYHGVQTPVSILKEDILFRGLGREIPVGRYHSWVVSRKDFPGCREITAESREGQIMALRHRTYDVHGIQFHPESVLTPQGKEIIKNFLNNR